MKQHEELRRHILENQRCNPSGWLHYLTIQLSNQFGIPGPHVCQILVDMSRSGLIDLAKWDGKEVKLFQDWRDADTFFYAATDGGHVRVQVLARGAELLDNMPKASIGFSPTSS